MQPPPRKGNYAKFLKNLHTEQVSKLQLKNQNECELLEDIRNFILKRSAIEKSYAEALLKISSAFLNRKIPNIPDIKTEGSEEKWNMWNVWRTVLEENEKLARARLAAVEVFSSHVADDAKILRANKLANAKRWIDQLSQVQKELQTCVLEVDKTKKAYFDEEHSAHDVRDKARDIEEKLKKKKGSFFQSITSLQKNSAKVTSKREALEEKSSGARNDYLLSLAAANAHQTRYFVVDFQSTIQNLEANVYEKVAEYLLLIARTELLTCTATQTSFNRIKEQSSQLSRDYNLQCVYLYYPVLKQHIQYEFEPCDNDNVAKVTAEHSSSSAALAKEAKRWATRIGRESANIRESMTKLQTLHSLRESGQKTDPNDPNGPDIDTKMDELRQAIRRAETAKAKAEARIECLRAGGVNVEEFLQEIENLNVQDLPRSSSSMSVRTDASGLGEQGGSDSMYDSDYNDGASESAGPTSLEEKERPDSAEVDGEWAMLEQERQRIEQLTAGWDDPTQVDWGQDGGETSAQPVGDGVIAYKCTALYSYTAQNPDELSIVENEQLEVVGEGDGDGWLKARNYKGEEGYVPHNYLDVEREEPWSAGKEGPQLTSQISFSSVDYTVDEEPSEQSVGQDTIKEAYRPPDLDYTVDEETSEESPGQDTIKEAYQPLEIDYTVGEEPWKEYVGQDTIKETCRPPDLELSGGDTYCIALYDYEATCPEELSFYEGDVIKVLRKVVHDDVDDGWWEGQKGDEIGLFPSLVVEECRENGEPLTPEGEDTPPGSAPPVFTPPEVPTFLLAPQSVIITQPTPVVESNPIIEETEEPTEDSQFSFSMELSGGQRKHYDTQFDEVQISVSVTGDDNEVNGENEEKREKEPDFGLSTCSVVITAATPMIEEAEKAFPSGEEEEEGVEKEKGDEEPPTYSQATSQPEEPAESAPFAHGSSTASEEDTYTGPSTAENSLSDSKRKHEIPDELEPHQLARLQDLKESDA